MPQSASVLELFSPSLVSNLTIIFGLMFPGVPGTKMRRWDMGGMPSDRSTRLLMASIVSVGSTGPIGMALPVRVRTITCMLLNMGLQRRGERSSEEGER